LYANHYQFDASRQRLGLLQEAIIYGHGAPFSKSLQGPISTIIFTQPGNI